MDWPSARRTRRCRPACATSPWIDLERGGAGRSACTGRPSVSWTSRSDPNATMCPLSLRRPPPQPAQRIRQDRSAVLAAVPAGAAHEFVVQSYQSPRNWPTCATTLVRTSRAVREPCCGCSSTTIGKAPAGCAAYVAPGHREPQGVAAGFAGKITMYSPAANAVPLKVSGIGR